MSKRKDVMPSLLTRTLWLWQEIIGSLTRKYYDPEFEEPWDPRLDYKIRDAVDRYQWRVLNYAIERSLKKERVGWQFNGTIAKIVESIFKDSLWEFPEFNEAVGMFVNRAEAKEKIALLLPLNEYCKYVRAQTQEGVDVVVAIPFPFHRDILEYFQEKTGEELSPRGGGYMYFEYGESTSIPKLYIKGSSRDFGRADHKKVAEMIGKNFPKLEIIVEGERFKL